MKKLIFCLRSVPQYVKISPNAEGDQGHNIAMDIELMCSAQTHWQKFMSRMEKKPF